MAGESLVGLTEPTNAVMPALAQDILTAFCYAVFVRCLVIAARKIATEKDDSFLILCLAGAMSCLLDPFVCFFTKAIHAPVGQYTMFRAFGKPAPFFLAPMYGFYLAGPAFFFNRAFKKTPAAGLFWKVFSILAIAVCVFELLPLRLGLWIYYGFQPFVFMKFPLYICFMNTTLVMAFAAVGLICLDLFSGVKRYLFLVLAPMSGYAVYGGVAWPVALALLGDVGYAGARVGAIASALLSLVACYFILQVMLLVVERLKQSERAMSHAQRSAA